MNGSARHVLVTVELTEPHAAALARFLSSPEARRAVHNGHTDFLDVTLTTEALEGLRQELLFQGIGTP